MPIPPSRTPLLAALALFLAGCGETPVATLEVTGETVVQRLTVLGSERDYRVYAPTTMSRGGSNPVLLVFHGALQSAGGIELMSWLYEEAEAHGTIVVYPDAGRDRWRVPIEGQQLAPNEDVQFVEAILDALDADVGIDRTRIWATGFSNGALMAQTLACSLPGRIAAIAPVAGSLPISLMATCPRDLRVPATIILGDRDPQFPWDEGTAALFRVLGGEGTAEWWAETNGCDDRVVDSVLDDADDGLEVRRRDWVECDAGGAVRLDRIAGGGHAWPGSPWKADFLRPKSLDLNGAEAVFDFVTRFHTPSGR